MLKQIIDLIELKEKVGICLDTCHIYDGGYDIVTKLDEVINLFDKIIGLEKLKAIHLNDTKNPFSSHKDRHENIGYGTIGFDNMIKIIYNKRIENIPKILETPYIDDIENNKKREYPPYKFEIEMIRDKKFNHNLLEDIRKYYFK